MRIIGNMDGGHQLLVLMERKEFEKISGKELGNNLQLEFNKVDEFLQWVSIQNFSYGYINTLTSYFKRIFAHKIFKNPLELRAYMANYQGFNNMIKVARNYLNFCGENELLSRNTIEIYRKNLKIRRSKYQTWAPDDEKVKQAYDSIKDHEKLRIVFLVLAASGIRITESLRLITNFDVNRVELRGNFFIYSINQTKGKKHCGDVFLPLFVLKYFDNKIKMNTYHGLLKRAKKKKCPLSLKYLRKWFYNLCLFNGVPAPVADIYQGRSPQTVGASNYLFQRKQAEFWYIKLSDILKNIFEGK